MFKPEFVLAVVMMSTLTACGTHPTPMAGNQPAGVVAADAKKSASKRPAPPAAPAGLAKKKNGAPQSFPTAQNASYIASSALGNYEELTRQWNYAYTDYEKDQIETRMLQVLHDAFLSVERELSDHGRDQQDRSIFNLADRGLDRYDTNYSRWQSTWSDTEKRLIINDMLRDMVDTLKQVVQMGGRG